MDAIRYQAAKEMNEAARLEPVLRMARMTAHMPHGHGSDTDHTAHTIVPETELATHTREAPNPTTARALLKVHLAARTTRTRPYRDNFTPHLRYPHLLRKRA